MEEKSNGLEQKNVDLVGLIEQPTWKTILIDLVKREKMDVWAIDIIELSQKYLQKIQEMKENNLRIPANAMLACAILLKLKSRTIRLPTEEPEQEPLPEIGELPELKPISRIKERSVTLDELLEEIEAVIEKTKSKMAIQERKEIIAIDVPTMIKHDLGKKIEELYEKITKSADEQGLVLFSQIVDKSTLLEVVTTFICLLFLASDARINLWQETFFGEIFIAIIKNNGDERNNKTSS
ncbi:MAG: segregation/condensation protein A [Candidatus Diapherotrites archaeon]|nr:segregation/condensation protein A [Candidatus Diapherotrites archaeon]